ncbi:MAG: AI-2E family transporter [Arachnia sp.]
MTQDSGDLVDDTSPALKTLRTLTLATALVIMIGFLLVVGQGQIVPILIALISVFILGAADAALARVPGIRRLPSIARKGLLLLVFLGVVALFTLMIISTVRELMKEAPTYQANLLSLSLQLIELVGISDVPDWRSIQDTLFGQINIQAMLSSVAGQLSSVGGAVFMVVVYALFLFGERAGFTRKLRLAIRDPERTERTMELVGEINERIGQYLGTKTLINIILGMISYAVMAGFGLDYAPFWAFLIGLLNYIPYIGSMVAVALPLALSLVQFASMPMSLGLLVGLGVAQISVAFILEPLMLGKRVNLSPFVVLASLGLWGAMWGIVGAILAVPLTAMLAIIFYEIPATRGLAVMMSEDTSALGQRLSGAARKQAQRWIKPRD